MSRFLTYLFLALTAGLLKLAGAPLHRAVLDNGDVLTGVVLEDSSVLRLDVDYLGAISIPRDRVRSLALVASGGGEFASGELRPDQEQRVDGDNALAAGVSLHGEETAEPAQHERGVLRDVLRGLRRLEAWSPLPLWDKRLQLGLNELSGRKEQSQVNYRLEMDRRFENSRVKLNAAYSYREANQQVNRDRLISRLQWRRNLAPGVFYESKSEYSWDRIKSIDSNLEQKFGLGRRLRDSDYSTVSAGLGASGRWRSFDDREEEVVYLVDLFQDWEYRMNERLTLNQDFRIAMPLEESDDYEVNLSAALVSEVTDSINLSLRYEFEYDNSLLDELRESRRLVSALGYSF